MGVAALAMRDTDRDLTTRILVRRDSDLNSLKDLGGKTIAVGAPDSAQATWKAESVLAEAGILSGKNCQVLYHDIGRQAWRSRGRRA